MTVAQILSRKGTAVVTASATDSVGDICRSLAENRVGAIVVTEGNGAIAGIVSERDIVRQMAAEGAAAMDRPVSDIMTRGVVTCTPSDSVLTLMTLMTERRIRHVPVVVNGRLRGIVSIGDVVKRRIEDAEREAEEMKRYIAEGT
ncbi:MAG: CBS domain-containing protein [Hyphomicrobiales bacterium]